MVEGIKHGLDIGEKYLVIVLAGLCGGLGGGGGGGW